MIHESSGFFFVINIILNDPDDLAGSGLDLPLDARDDTA